MRPMVPPQASNNNIIHTCVHEERDGLKMTHVNACVFMCFVRRILTHSLILVTAVKMIVMTMRCVVCPRQGPDRNSMLV